MCGYLFYILFILKILFWSSVFLFSCCQLKNFFILFIQMPKTFSLGIDWSIYFDIHLPEDSNYYYYKAGFLWSILWLQTSQSLRKSSTQGSTHRSTLGRALPGPRDRGAPTSLPAPAPSKPLPRRSHFCNSLITGGNKRLLVYRERESGIRHGMKVCILLSSCQGSWW